MPCIRLIEHHDLSVAVKHASARLFHHQYARADVPFVNRTKRQRAVARAAGDLRQPVGDAADGLDDAVIDEELKLFARLRTTDQKQRALELGARRDANRPVV